tara:strand:+ start:632 stop:859 length:228 start_codon:yes stop_codon:yes gene_type:complete
MKKNEYNIGDLVLCGRYGITYIAIILNYNLHYRKNYHGEAVPIGYTYEVFDNNEGDSDYIDEEDVLRILSRGHNG